MYTTPGLDGDLAAENTSSSDTCVAPDSVHKPSERNGRTAYVFRSQQMSHSCWVIPILHVPFFPLHSAQASRFHKLR